MTALVLGTKDLTVTQTDLCCHELFILVVAERKYTCKQTNRIISNSDKLYEENKTEKRE